MEIRPVSDLRNKYPEIEKLVLNEEQAVYLTKNGYGSMVVMSLEKFSKLTQNNEIERTFETKFGSVDVEEALDMSEEEIDNDARYLTHEEVFSKIRGIIDGENV